MNLDAVIAAIIDTVPEPYAARAISRVRALGETKGQLAQLAEANPELLHVLETQHPDLIAELKRRLNAEPAAAVAPPAASQSTPAAAPVAAPIPTPPTPEPAPAPVPTPTPAPPPATPEPAPPAATPPGTDAPKPDDKPKKPGRPSVPNF